ncbi:golgi snare bet1-related [Holotrichia oblita]|uniref:Golgi snare bet1-related n=1 Tax=Holotrichia oblita TaxID=644536 RepID=A0ACB9T353_HOLOL|nr:golgi snare bet1-related [Holotrichia oblita]
MRRAHAGNYYEPLSQNPNELEDENDRRADELKEKVKILRDLSIDIGNEVKYQDKLLRDVDDDMDRTGGFLGNSMNRVLRYIAKCFILDIRVLKCPDKYLL